VMAFSSSSSMSIFCPFYVHFLTLHTVRFSCIIGPNGDSLCRSRMNANRVWFVLVIENR
jgi:hypothetical protein